MKTLARAFSLILITLCVINGAAAKVKCIVIDPGHGGKDPGAVSGKLQEKNIVLSTALELGAIIGEKYPDIEIVYTRKDDRFIELSRRSDIANKAGADLFISIHTNASKSSSACGTETFVMGVDRSNDNLEVAMRENNVITYESDYSSKYEGYDPTSSESFIIFSLMQYAYLTQSLKLAAFLQQEYSGRDNRRDRGVKQAGFLVLWRTAMPSILSEIGFISNPDEAKYISSPEGQKKIAASLFRAVEQYIEQENGNDDAFTRETPLKEASVDKQPEKQGTAQRKEPGEPASANSAKDTEFDKKRSSGENVCFRMQVKSSSRPVSVTYENFGALMTGIEEVKVGDFYKYYCGKTKSYKEALILQQKVRKYFSDAFCVAFDGDEQIAMDKAKKLRP